MVSISHHGFQSPGPASEVLQAVDVQGFSRSDCRDMLDYTGKYLFENSESCAFNVDNAHGICDGDLGAPLVKDDILYGVYNWQTTYCQYPTVYSSIPYFHDWIVEQTKL